MKQQLLTMLELQNSMNSKVHLDWKNQGYEWYRAIWIECAELMDHFGWKWWKKQDTDRDQVILELIDIWHFGLSSLLQSGVGVNEIAQSLKDEMDFKSQDRPFVDLVEEFAQDVLTTKRFSVTKFVPLLVAMGLSFDQLYRSYVGKNVLNFFRQDNGYKDGSYRKVWQGREDNEHLVEIIDLLDITRETFQHDVYQALFDRYRGV